MKKLLVLLLIFLLSLGMVGCGNNDDTPSGDEDNTPVSGQEGEGEGEDGDGDSEGEDEDVEFLNPDELYMSEDGAMDDYGVAFDLGVKADSDFAMIGTIEKVSYSDLSSHISTMEDRLSTEAGKALTGQYIGFADFEEYEGEDIDKLTYAVAMEDDDSEKSYLEVGVYHSTVTDKHYQYTVFTSDNAYEFDKDFIKASLAEFEDAFGVKLSQSKTEAAVKEVLEVAKETEDYYSVYERISASGSGYDETITVSVDGFCNEDGSLGYYIALERERCYS